MYELTSDYKGKWTDIVVNVKWSDSAQGSIRVWINGKEKFNYAGKTLLCTGGAYFRYGIYRSFVSRNWTATQISTTVYYDGIRISKTGEGMFDPLVE